MTCFEELSADIYGMDLQPCSNGNLLAMACQDGILRLYDTKSLETGELFYLIQFL